MTTEITGWQMLEKGAPVERRTYTGEVGPGQALVEVAGCGVCHTDISFLHTKVDPRHALPLTLGHEVSGFVRQVGEGADASLVGRPVVVPAVMPCGECDLCRSGYRPICRSQFMPGNDGQGGFADQLVVPARWLAPVGDDVLATHELWELSIIADAVSTPFMAVKRSKLAAGQLAIVVGVGGIGVYAVQIASAMGATVVALDIDPVKLEAARAAGARAMLDVRGMSPRDVKKAVRSLGKELGAPPALHRIFECSGTGAGQATAFALMGPGAYLSVVGFTMEKLELRLSNLMAFDATVQGNWGCDPMLYPAVLEWVADGRISLSPFVEKHPLEDINAIFDAAHHGTLSRRAVLVP